MVLTYLQVTKHRHSVRQNLSFVNFREIPRLGIPQSGNPRPLTLVPGEFHTQLLRGAETHAGLLIK